jgi:hypothetical protein
MTQLLIDQQNLAPVRATNLQVGQHLVRSFDEVLSIHAIYQDWSINEVKLVLKADDGQFKREVISKESLLLVLAA